MTQKVELLKIALCQTWCSQDTTQHLAKDMAYQQSGIAKSNMNQAADLEMRNKKVAMEMMSSTKELIVIWDNSSRFQNRFAEDQNVRDITTRYNNNQATQLHEFGNRAS